MNTQETKNETAGASQNRAFQNDPRDYALRMVEEGLVSADQMLLCTLKYMSHDDVRDMLDANELSPRFNEDDDESEDEQ